MITLTNVIDIRTGQHHSVAIVSDRNAKWYKQIDSEKTESKANNTNEETAR